MLSGDENREKSFFRVHFTYNELLKRKKKTSKI